MIGGIFKFSVGTRNSNRLMSTVYVIVNEDHKVNTWHPIIR